VETQHTRTPESTDWTPESEAWNQSRPDFTSPACLFMATITMVAVGMTAIGIEIQASEYSNLLASPMGWLLVAIGLVMGFFVRRSWLKAWRRHETQNQQLKSATFELIDITPGAGRLLTLHIRTAKEVYSVSISRTALFSCDTVNTGVQFPGASVNHVGSIDFGKLALIAAPTSFEYEPLLSADSRF